MSEKLYAFEKAIKVNGVLHSAGDILPESKIPKGHLASMLRQGHIREHVEGDLASQFAAVMAAGLPAATAKRGSLVALPNGFEVIAPGVPEEDHKAAVAEIYRLRDLHAQKSGELSAALLENEALKARVAELEAAGKSAEAPAEDKKPDPEPEKKPDDKPSGGAKPPAVGPAKPPDLKAGGGKK